MGIQAILTTIVALIFILIGYLIRKYQMVEVIGGYDPKRVTDKKGLAKLGRL